MRSRSNPGASPGKTRKTTASGATRNGRAARGASAPSAKRGTRRTAAKAKTRSSGPIVFFVALFIVALGAIQLLSTFYTYAISVSELNGLKREEAALIAKKQDLENDIARWNDKAYVAAQARDKLGFVFPGEQVVHVLHPEAVTGSAPNDKTDTGDEDSGKKSLPWYSELAYSFEQADKKADEATTAGNDQKNANGTSGTTQDNVSDGTGSTETDHTTEDQQQ
ncbi:MULTISPECIES: FtsB family cell division protein [Bifidobacterium]|uniref:FtsB family cell division protein n=1 Tax=Bifidobacterium TaxID=1678 RepID=UPI001BDC7609|nr:MULTISPECIES: septum formation initiator family protein [Bifidobacterium]MBT1162434.1 septum formation initiator family protein [Bifidobacterium sp. SO1]MBW3078299.1 septum formation initiator family protein [Bifidobacterium simiiventris]